MIGLFDSGIGGLTVLKSLLKILPNEDYIYLGDTARLPYGTKSPETIKRYTEQNIHFLESKGVDCVVSACHSASSSILKYQITSKNPLYNVIEPACSEAKKRSKNKTVGLLATAATVNAGQYGKLISAPYTLISEPAPLLVPLVENNWLDDDVTRMVIERYVARFIESQTDAVILGCTHYPLLSAEIKKALGPECMLIDPGMCLAHQISATVPAKSTPGTVKIYLTDQSPFFTQLAQQILAKKDLDIQQVDL